MKYYKSLLIFIVAAISVQTLYSQRVSNSVYVIVHGAWGGGWAFKEVDSLLTAKGNTVYRPTLTGQGERVHLASTDVGLKTHITDIVNTILYEELYNVILIGHSYGGMVITGVADSIPERIQKLIYVDAILPEHGESAVTIMDPENESSFRNANGFVIPPWVPEGQKPPKDVPHPYKTLSDSIILKNPLRMKIPTTYILTVEKGKEPKDDDFASQAERAKKKGWVVLKLDADHNAQWSAPVELVELLQGIVEK